MDSNPVDSAKGLNATREHTISSKSPTYTSPSISGGVNKRHHIAQPFQQEDNLSHALILTYPLPPPLPACPPPLNPPLPVDPPPLPVDSPPPNPPLLVDLPPLNRTHPATHPSPSPLLLVDPPSPNSPLPANPHPLNPSLSISISSTDLVKTSSVSSENISLPLLELPSILALAVDVELIPLLHPPADFDYPLQTPGSPLFFPESLVPLSPQLEREKSDNSISVSRVHFEILAEIVPPPPVFDSVLETPISIVPPPPVFESVLSLEGSHTPCATFTFPLKVTSEINVLPLSLKEAIPIIAPPPGFGSNSLCDESVSSNSSLTHAVEVLPLATPQIPRDDSLKASEKNLLSKYTAETLSTPGIKSKYIITETTEELMLTSKSPSEVKETEIHDTLDQFQERKSSHRSNCEVVYPPFGTNLLTSSDTKYVSAISHIREWDLSVVCSSRESSSCQKIFTPGNSSPTTISTSKITETNRSSSSSETGMSSSPWCVGYHAQECTSSVKGEATDKPTYRSNKVSEIGPTRPEVTLQHKLWQVEKSIKNEMMDQDELQESCTVAQNILQDNDVKNITLVDRVGGIYHGMHEHYQEQSSQKNGNEVPNITMERIPFFETQVKSIVTHPPTTNEIVNIAIHKLPEDEKERNQIQETIEGAVFPVDIVYESETKDNFVYQTNQPTCDEDADTAVKKISENERKEKQIPETNESETLRMDQIPLHETQVEDTEIHQATKNDKVLKENDHKSTNEPTNNEILYEVGGKISVDEKERKYNPIQPTNNKFAALPMDQVPVDETVVKDNIVQQNQTKKEIIKLEDYQIPVNKKKGNENMTHQGKQPTKNGVTGIKVEKTHVIEAQVKDIMVHSPNRQLIHDISDIDKTLVDEKEGNDNKIQTASRLTNTEIAGKMVQVLVHGADVTYSENQQLVKLENECNENAKIQIGFSVMEAKENILQQNVLSNSCVTRDGGPQEFSAQVPDKWMENFDANGSKTTSVFGTAKFVNKLAESMPATEIINEERSSVVQEELKKIVNMEFCEVVRTQLGEIMNKQNSIGSNESNIENDNKQRSQSFVDLCRDNIKSPELIDNFSANVSIENTQWQTFDKLNESHSVTEQQNDITMKNEHNVFIKSTRVPVTITGRLTNDLQQEIALLNSLPIDSTTKGCTTLSIKGFQSFTDTKAQDNTGISFETDHESNTNIASTAHHFLHASKPLISSSSDVEIFSPTQNCNTELSLIKEINFFEKTDAYLKPENTDVFNYHVLLTQNQMEDAIKKLLRSTFQLSSTAQYLNPAAIKQLIFDSIVNEVSRSQAIQNFELVLRNVERKIQEVLKPVRADKTVDALNCQLVAIQNPIQEAVKHLVVSVLQVSSASQHLNPIGIERLLVHSIVNKVSGLLKNENSGSITRNVERKLLAVTKSIEETKNFSVYLPTPFGGTKQQQLFKPLYHETLGVQDTTEMKKLRTRTLKSKSSNVSLFQSSADPRYINPGALDIQISNSPNPKTLRAVHNRNTAFDTDSGKNKMGGGVMINFENSDEDSMLESFVPQCFKSEDVEPCKIKDTYTDTEVTNKDIYANYDATTNFLMVDKTQKEQYSAPTDKTCATDNFGEVSEIIYMKFHSASEKKNMGTDAAMSNDKSAIGKSHDGKSLKSIYFSGDLKKRTCMRKSFVPTRSIHKTVSEPFINIPEEINTYDLFYSEAGIFKKVSINYQPSHFANNVRFCSLDNNEKIACRFGGVANIFENCELSSPLREQPKDAQTSSNLDFSAMVSVMEESVRAEEQNDVVGLITLNSDRVLSSESSPVKDNSSNTLPFVNFEDPTRNGKKSKHSMKFINNINDKISEISDYENLDSLISNKNYNIRVPSNIINISEDDNNEGILNQTTKSIDTLSDLQTSGEMPVHFKLESFQTNGRNASQTNTRYFDNNDSEIFSILTENIKSLPDMQGIKSGHDDLSRRFDYCDRDVTETTLTNIVSNGISKNVENALEKSLHNMEEYCCSNVTNNLSEIESPSPISPVSYDDATYTALGNIPPIESLQVSHDENKIDDIKNLKFSTLHDTIRSLDFKGNNQNKSSENSFNDLQSVSYMPGFKTDHTFIWEVENKTHNRSTKSKEVFETANSLENAHCPLKSKQDEKPKCPDNTLNNDPTGLKPAVLEYESLSEKENSTAASDGTISTSSKIKSNHFSTGISNHAELDVLKQMADINNANSDGIRINELITTENIISNTSVLVNNISPSICEKETVKNSETLDSAVSESISESNTLEIVSQDEHVSNSDLTHSDIDPSTIYKTHCSVLELDDELSPLQKNEANKYEEHTYYTCQNNTTEGKSIHHVTNVDLYFHNEVTCSDNKDSVDVNKNVDDNCESIHIAELTSERKVDDMVEASVIETISTITYHVGNDGKSDDFLASSPLETPELLNLHEQNQTNPTVISQKNVHSDRIISEVSFNGISQTYSTSDITCTKQRTTTSSLRKCISLPALYERQLSISPIWPTIIQAKNSVLIQPYIQTPRRNGLKKRKRISETKSCKKRRSSSTSSIEQRRLRWITRIPARYSNNFSIMNGRLRFNRKTLGSARILNKKYVRKNLTKKFHMHITPSDRNTETSAQLTMTLNSIEAAPTMVSQIMSKMDDNSQRRIDGSHGFSDIYSENYSSTDLFSKNNPRSKSLPPPKTSSYKILRLESLGKRSAKRLRSRRKLTFMSWKNSCRSALKKSKSYKRQPFSHFERLMSEWFPTVKRNVNTSTPTNIVAHDNVNVFFPSFTDSVNNSSTDINEHTILESSPFPTSEFTVTPSFNSSVQSSFNDDGKSTESSLPKNKRRKRRKRNRKFSSSYGRLERAKHYWKKPLENKTISTHDLPFVPTSLEAVDTKGCLETGCVKDDNNLGQEKTRFNLSVSDKHYFLRSHACSSSQDPTNCNMSNSPTFISLLKPKRHINCRSNNECSSSEIEAPPTSSATHQQSSSHLSTSLLSFAESSLEDHYISSLPDFHGESLCIPNFKVTNISSPNPSSLPTSPASSASSPIPSNPGTPLYLPSPTRTPTPSPTDSSDLASICASPPPSPTLSDPGISLFLPSPQRTPMVSPTSSSPDPSPPPVNDGSPLYLPIPTLSPTSTLSSLPSPPTLLSASPRSHSPSRLLPPISPPSSRPPTSLSSSPNSPSEMPLLASPSLQTSPPVLYLAPASNPMSSELSPPLLIPESTVPASKLPIASPRVLRPRPQNQALSPPILLSQSLPTARRPRGRPRIRPLREGAVRKSPGSATVLEKRVPVSRTRGRPRSRPLQKGALRKSLHPLTVQQSSCIVSQPRRRRKLSETNTLCVPSRPHRIFYPPLTHCTSPSTQHTPTPSPQSSLPPSPLSSPLPSPSLWFQCSPSPEHSPQPSPLSHTLPQEALPFLFPSSTCSSSHPSSQPSPPQSPVQSATQPNAQKSTPPQHSAQCSTSPQPPSSSQSSLLIPTSPQPPYSSPLPSKKHSCLLPPPPIPALPPLPPFPSPPQLRGNSRGRRLRVACRCSVRLRLHSAPDAQPEEVLRVARVAAQRAIHNATNIALGNALTGALAHAGGKIEQIEDEATGQIRIIPETTVDASNKTESLVARAEDFVSASANQAHKTIKRYKSFDDSSSSDTSRKRIHREHLEDARSQIHQISKRARSLDGKNASDIVPENGLIVPENYLCEGDNSININKSVSVDDSNSNHPSTKETVIYENNPDCIFPCDILHKDPSSSSHLIVSKYFKNIRDSSEGFNSFSQKVVDVNSNARASEDFCKTSTLNDVGQYAGGHDSMKDITIHTASGNGDGIANISDVGMPSDVSVYHSDNNNANISHQIINAISNSVSNCVNDPSPIVKEISNRSLNGRSRLRTKDFPKSFNNESVHFNQSVNIENKLHTLCSEKQNKSRSDSESDRLTTESGVVCHDDCLCYEDKTPLKCSDISIPTSHSGRRSQTPVGNKLGESSKSKSDLAYEEISVDPTFGMDEETLETPEVIRTLISEDARKEMCTVERNDSLDTSENHQNRKFTASENCSNNSVLPLDFPITDQTESDFESTVRVSCKSSHLETDNNHPQKTYSRSLEEQLHGTKTFDVTPSSLEESVRGTITNVASEARSKELPTHPCVRPTTKRRFKNKISQFPAPKYQRKNYSRPDEITLSSEFNNAVLKNTEVFNNSTSAIGKHYDKRSTNITDVPAKSTDESSNSTMQKMCSSSKVSASDPIPVNSSIILNNSTSKVSSKSFSRHRSPGNHKPSAGHDSKNLHFGYSEQHKRVEHLSNSLSSISENLTCLPDAHNINDDSSADVISGNRVNSTELPVESSNSKSSFSTSTRVFSQKSTLSSASMSEQARLSSSTSHTCSLPSDQQESSDIVLSGRQSSRRSDPLRLSVNYSMTPSIKFSNIESMKESELSQCNPSCVKVRSSKGVVCRGSVAAASARAVVAVALTLDSRRLLRRLAKNNEMALRITGSLRARLSFE